MEILRPGHLLMGAKEGKGVAAVVKLYESWEGVIFIVSIRCFCYWIMVIFYGGYIYNIGIGLRKVKMNQIRKGLQISNYLLFNNIHRFCQSSS